MIANNKIVLIITITFLTLAMITSVPIVNAVPTNVPNDGSAYCEDAGKREGQHGLVVVKCCWAETVSPGSGDFGNANQFEMWCAECQDGGTRGLINCTDPWHDLASKDNSIPSFPGTIMDGPISDVPLSGTDDNSNPDLGSDSGATRGGLENLQNDNNNIIEAAPESSEDDESTTTTIQEQTESVEPENTLEESPN